MSVNRECPLVPMGAVTGKPDRKMISETLTALREVGITQYLIYPRSGCELEYLSPEWFDTCRIFFAEGERLGFTSMWLYDEFNWPSGQCGGRIMRENPDYALHYLQVFEENGSFTLRKGRNPVRPDVLGFDAMRAFLQSTHEKYAEHFAPLFGRLIKGFFTDEPSFLYIWHGEKNPSERLRIPYYPGLEEEYTALTGNRLENDLICSLRQGGDPFWQPFVHRLLGNRFRDAFLRPVRDWCTAHNLFLTGHLMDESSPGRSLAASGRPLEIIDQFTLPGMDEIFTRQFNDNMEWLTFATAEHGIRHAGNGGLAELFALGPADMTLARMKKMIRLTGMFGVDHYVLAVAQLDMRGNVEKNSYFNPYSRTQPWFRALKQLGEDAAFSAEIAEKPFTPEVQIRYPGMPRPLNDLLIQLIDRQRNWSVISEEESGSAPFILRLEQDGITEERSGRTWISIEVFLKDFDEMAPPRVYVSEADGRRARDLFLRSYCDGSVEVVNLSRSPEGRKLRLHRNGRIVPFTLTFDGTASFGGWKIELDRPNLKRLEFENGLCRITTKKTLSGLTLSLRNYGGNAELLLDGVPVAAEEECRSLPQGFRELYRESTTFDLPAGEHRLEFAAPCRDYSYLPVAFLAGAFADGEDGLDRYAGDGDGLRNYIGKLIQQGEVNIPADAALLRLETDGLYTELFLDGESLGERAWAPFAWRIPDRFAGRRVTLRVERYTSCGPMFGTRAFSREGGDDWLRTYAPQGGVRHPVSEPVFE